MTAAPYTRIGLCLSFAVFAASPAIACRDSDPVELKRFLSADVVVVGRVANYREIKDPYWRQKTNVDPDFKQSFASDFVRFEIEVEQVLAGRAPSILSVAWDAGWMGEPKTMADGPYIFGLHHPKFNLPHTRSANDANQEPILPRVISTGCGGDLVVKSDSALGRDIIKRLTR